MASPLADKIRPKTLADVVGQEHLLSEKALFRRVVESGNIPNMVFFGNSGTGKTTVAEIVAKSAGKTMRKLNATTATLSDIKDICAETGTVFGSGGILLYLDEIQYFNKKQQQSLLEFMEDGRITLICSTTENPYFSIYPALLSRSSVFEFKPVKAEDIKKALTRALDILDAEYEKEHVDRSEAVGYLANCCGGDVRKAIGALELCYFATNGAVSVDSAEESLNGFALKLDRDGNEHYDLVSALQKSIRGSDENAALFYLARLLEGGDLLSPIRRLLVIASEDIGLAYPMAAVITKACVDNALTLGLPEARIPLAEAVLFLATLPKSNSAYEAYSKATQDIATGKGQAMPNYLRDGMHPSSHKNKDYIYPHPYPNHYVEQQYLPDDIKDRIYYEYADNKQEKAAKQYWDKIKKKTETGN